MQYPVYNWGQTCTKWNTLFRTNFHAIVYPVWDREDKNHTLSFSSTSLHRPIKDYTPRSPNNICRNSESLSLEGCKMVPQDEESCVLENFGPFSNLGSSFYGSLSLIFGWFCMLEYQVLICKSQSIWKPGSRSLAKSQIYYSQARSKHKMTGELSEWPTLTPHPPYFGPSANTYFLVHVKSLHLSTIPFVLVSNFPFVLTLTK